MEKRSKRNAALTRERLLGAAVNEFATHGLAGARIDRIAATAGVSKPMLYNYFGDKEALFDAVLTREIVAAADEEPFDAADLPTYAARTYDLLVERPRLWRLLTWYHLERGLDVLVLPAGRDLLMAKQASILTMQAEGRLTTDFDPMAIIRMVALLSQLWCMAEPAQTGAEHAERRDTITRAVARLLKP